MERDFYVVVRSFLDSDAENHYKSQKETTRHLHSFRDYNAAKAFFDLHETYAAMPSYEDQEQCNYVYAVAAFSMRRAEAKLKKSLTSQQRLLAVTPFSVRLSLRNYWRDEQKARADIESEQSNGAEQ